MKKNVTFAPVMEQGYVSPEMNVVEIFSEGVLCESGTIDSWGEDELLWD